MFAADSRYAGLPVAEVTQHDGSVVHYVRARLVPDPTGLSVVGTHTVATGDRLDRIAAARYLRPGQAWRIADAHRTLDPDSLTATPGTVLLFTVPAGLLTTEVLPGG